MYFTKIIKQEHCATLCYPLKKQETSIVFFKNSNYKQTLKDLEQHNMRV